MSDKHLTEVSAIMQRDRMFAVDEQGHPITRERTCECGRKFTQRLLSERFMEIVERHSKRAMDVFLKQVPGFYVPVHCPPCEDRDLGRMARKVELSREPQRDWTEPVAAD